MGRNQILLHGRIGELASAAIFMRDWSRPEGEPEANLLAVPYVIAPQRDARCRWLKAGRRTGPHSTKHLLLVRCNNTLENELDMCSTNAGTTSGAMQT